MTSDEQVKFYNQMIKSATEEARKHSKPSPETLKIINNMENQMIQIENKLSNIEEQLKKVPTIEGMQLANEKTLKAFFEEADKRYATKLTEKLVYYMAGVILTYVLIAVLGLVIYKTN